MPNPERNADSQTELPAHELLKSYDDLTALNTCNAFVTQALAAALLNNTEERKEFLCLIRC